MQPQQVSSSAQVKVISKFLFGGATFDRFLRPMTTNEKKKKKIHPIHLLSLLLLLLELLRPPLTSQLSRPKLLKLLNSDRRIETWNFWWTQLIIDWPTTDKFFFFFFFPGVYRHTDTRWTPFSFSKQRDVIAWKPAQTHKSSEYFHLQGTHTQETERTAFNLTETLCFALLSAPLQQERRVRGENKKKNSF